MKSFSSNGCDATDLGVMSVDASQKEDVCLFSVDAQELCERREIMINMCKKPNTKKLFSCHVKSEEKN